MRIKKRLPLMIILLSLIPLFLVSFLVYNYTSKTVISNSESNISQIVKSESNTLSAIIHGQKREVDLSVQKPSVADSLESRLII